MNSSTLSKLSAVSIGLLVSPFLSLGAATPNEVAPPVHACAGATTVAVYAVRPQFPNGRGPLVTVQTGTKTICHSCPVTTEVATHALSNGRGPSHKTVVVQTGVEHACTTCAPVAKL